MTVLKRTIIQVAVIVMAGFIIGIAVNQIRPDGLAIIPKQILPKASSSATEVIEFISANDAYKLLKSSSAFFIDARDVSSYNGSHIFGASNIYPGKNYDYKKIGDKKNSLIITYCDGEGCQLAHKLAQELINNGFKKVRVMNEGMPVWSELGYPAEGS